MISSRIIFDYNAVYMLIIYDGMCMLQCYFNTKSNEENNLDNNRIIDNDNNRIRTPSHRWEYVAL